MSQIGPDGPDGPDGPVPGMTGPSGRYERLMDARARSDRRRRWAVAGYVLAQLAVVVVVVAHGLPRTGVVFAGIAVVSGLALLGAIGFGYFLGERAAVGEWDRSEALALGGHERSGIGRRPGRGRPLGGPWRGRRAARSAGGSGDPLAAAADSPPT
ncbi:hypothetical protein CU254_41665 (plasmid) [Amycolatopsis sp. AA4]|uniref:hypothetical protein n=1 Tax=Actinomycetes TaxID=1760 RepID=UPI0001B55179|nr:MULTISPECIES: hypothetical protein [Actinomycetes]ATY17089.1 hypothetical protein CU254_41665 [Amycolatopsis sp. AA4]EFL12406.1 predicted protein [Streptomyces sp. AA4]